MKLIVMLLDSQGGRTKAIQYCTWFDLLELYLNLIWPAWAWQTPGSRFPSLLFYFLSVPELNTNVCQNWRKVDSTRWQNIGKQFRTLSSSESPAWWSHCKLSPAGVHIIPNIFLSSEDQNNGPSPPLPSSSHQDSTSCRSSSFVP